MLLRCAPLLLALASVQAGESLVIEAPGANTQLGEGGIITIAGQGFVARRGDWLLTGEALRWDQHNDSLFATGGVVFVMPSVRLHADKLGMRTEARTGDAWGVEAWIEKDKRRLRITAARVELRPDRLTFHDVVGDFGHGGTMSLHCPRLHVYIREEQRMDKGANQIDRYVEGIAAVRPTVEMAGVPVLWFPYLYRDYVLDYPWSTVEVGQTNRLGAFLRYQVGSNLPEFTGWHTRIQGRADRYTRAGNGFGAELIWKNETYGRGNASIYRMYRERVADPADQSQQGGERDVNSWDAAHYVAGRGWAAAGRYTVLPDADESATLPDGRSPDERFRADYQKRALEEQPFARRGLNGAWVTPFLAFMADIERRPNNQIDETERLLGADITLPRLGLVGPWAVDGRIRAERLSQEAQDTEATRVSWESRMEMVKWVGGVGFDVSAGGRGVVYSDGRISGVNELGSESITIPVGEAGIRVRLLATGETTSGMLTPRLGVEVLGTARGSGNPGYDFGDGVDTPDSDRHYFLTGLDGELHVGSVSCSAEVVARWGIRQVDQEAVEVDGSVRSSASSLADLTFRARGSPHRDVDTVADGVWDARLARWSSFDARGRWRVAERVELLYNGAYVPPTISTGDTWLHRAGGALYLNRYRLDTWGEVRPGSEARSGGRNLDTWHLGVARRMIDGIAAVSYENAFDPTQGSVDNRISATFVFGGDEKDVRDPVLKSYGF